MANNNFVVKNGLTVNGSFTANSTAVNASAILATSVNTATANATTSIVVGANVTINTSTYFVGNATVNTSIIGGQISLSGATVNSTIYQGTANNANNLGGVAAASYVNTSGAYTVTGIHTHQANILMGNTTVNTQISNATILISNSTSTTTLGLTDLRIGNTTTNVVISNTTSTFGGNVSIRSNLTAKNTNYTFNLPNVGVSAQWIKLGTFTATQDGQHIFIKVVTGAGYSASDTQETEVYIHFKTSNGSALDANGFAGDSTYYVTNANNSAYVVKIVGNAAGGSATSFDIYFYQAGTFNGLGTFYTVELGQTTSTWTNSSTLTTDPGVASSTVQVASNRYIIQSNVAIGSGATSADSTLKVLGTANVSGNAAIGGNLTATGSISGANVTTTTNVATIGTAAYFVANGNVGIGTSSPGSKLTVTSTTTGSYEIGRFQGAANSSPFLYLITTGGAPNYTLLSYGPQPSAVYPTLTIRGFYSNATGGDAGGYPQLELVRSGGNTSITTATPDGAILSRIISYGSNSSSSLPGTIIESVAEANFTTTSTSGIRFQTTNAGSLAEAVRIAANGNVGIGNNAPNAKLVVTGTANVSGDVAIGGNVSISGVIKGQATALSGDVLFIGDNSKLVDINVLDTAGLYSQSNTLIGSLKLGSNGGIISGFNGKIGIANLAPDATLSITGTANVSGNVVIGGVTTSTGNITLGSSAFFVGNGVSITTVNATSVTTGTLPDARLSSAVVNTSGNFTVAGNIDFTAANINFTNINVGANVDVNTTAYFIGNTTANAVVNSTAFTVANSTVTFSYISPTSAQKANTTFYLNANGSWAAVAAGGSGSFNTNNNTAIAIAANTTLQTAYTAPATAGIRYVIYSVHVTNIGAANATISCNFNGSTYANISFAQSVPVPVGSSVEMLKKPKIMQPSDVLRLQASADSTLHATISYETQTGTTLFGTGIDIATAATYTDLYTATAVAVVESVLLMNDDGVYDCKARVVWTDGSNNIQGYYCYDLIVPAGATIEVLEASKALPNGYKVRVYCNVADRLEAMIAGKVAG